MTILSLTKNPYVLCAVILGGISLSLGWFIARNLLSSSKPEMQIDPLQLKPYTFDIDIADGYVSSANMSVGHQENIYTIRQVTHLKLEGLKREKNRLEFTRIIETSSGLDRNKILEILIAIELAPSLQEKSKLETQLAKLISSTKAGVSYGSFVGRKSE